jgi:4-oxalomesaconate tautomerase
VVGSKTGSLLPTGSTQEVVLGTEVTCIDAAMPIVLLRASDVRKTGYESPQELETDREFFQQIESIRVEAGLRMGLGNVTERVIPKVAIVSAPRQGGTLTSRYFTPDRAHPSYAVSGAICVSVAARLPGTIAYELANCNRHVTDPVSIEHASGKIDLTLEITTDPEFNVKSATLMRTARKLMSRLAYIPSEVWSGR